MRWKPLVLLSFSLGASAIPPTDVGYDLLFADTLKEVDQECTDAPGLPSFFNGNFYISGPAQFSIGGIKFKCALDAFGKINKFELANKQVCFSAKMLRTGFYNDSIKANTVAPGLLFLGTDPPRKCPFYNPMCNLLDAQGDNNYVNTLKVGDDYTLISDTSLMLDFDPKSLRVLGHRKFKEKSWVHKLHIGALGSAHPLKPREGNFWIELLMESPMMGKSYLDIYKMCNSNDGRVRTLIRSIQTNNTQYMHSFGMTNNYVILPFNLALDMMKAMPPHPPSMENAFVPDWDGIHVVSLDNGEVQKFDLEPFFHVHVANSYENETGIVFDVTQFKSNPFKGAGVEMKLQLNATVRDNYDNLGELKRHHLHLAGPLKGQVTTEMISIPGRSTDFTKINDKYSGVHYCIYYANEWKHDDHHYASMAVLKHNLCTGERQYWYQEGWYPSEPFFVSGSENVEDEGSLIFTALHGVTGISYLFTIDAQTMAVQVKVALSARIAFTAHGEYFPSK